ncbi:hypothetical protein ACHAW5_008972 [Stephanodiscus triporus]|uniref:GPI inositol-deacylase n=1 Tax=Stephanodiscus triporus TaxID=2934178 RepID=A0ABD3NVN5_9STRA
MRAPVPSSSSSCAAATTLLVASFLSWATAYTATTTTPGPPPPRGLGIPSTVSLGRATTCGRSRPPAHPSFASLSTSMSFSSSSSSSPFHVDESSPPDDSPTDVDGRDAPGRGRRRRIAILLCPAQFCVPADYAGLLDDIRARARDDDDSEIDVVASRVAPLPRTEWIKVARQLPTKDFLEANLNARATLGWYFDAMERALSELFAEASGGGGDDFDLCLIGHSIGGWVARAYLGGLSGSSTAVYRLAKTRLTSLVTLGTPHSSPRTALVDQTRGLLREVESTLGCTSKSLSDSGRVGIACVGSSGIGGKILTFEAEELIAAASYLPLIGRIGPDVRGDGIVPTDLAFMEHPARRVVIDGCAITGSAVRHAHVLPTPWNLLDGNAPSWSLPEGIIWYGSPGVLDFVKRGWLINDITSVVEFFLSIEFTLTLE